jgi:hypothetical protein
LTNWDHAPNIVRIRAGRAPQCRVAFSSRQWPIDPHRYCNAFLHRAVE